MLGLENQSEVATATSPAEKKIPIVLQGEGVMTKQMKNEKFLLFVGIGLLLISGVVSGEEKWKPTLNLYLSGGLGFVNSGDFNTIVRGEKDQWGDADEYFDWAEWKNMLDFQGEFILDLTRNIGIGFGSGYLSKKSEGRYGEPDYEFQRNYSFRFIPISGSLYLTIPAGTIVSFFIKGGADYYFGKMRQEEKIDYSGNQILVTEDASCNILGFHIGGGMEFKVAPKVSVVINGLYRIANFKKWTGKGHDEDEISSRDWDGELYFYENHQLWDGEMEWIPRLTLTNESMMPSNRRNTRSGEINIGGLVLTAGLKIGF